MMNVCSNCGMYHVDKTIDPSGPFAVCPACGHRHPFIYQPLLVVSGASGSGKTTLCRHLTGRYQQAVLLDSDILWREAFNQPDSNYRDYFETWLRVCKNIAQSGQPVVLFGAGIGVPHNLEPCIERRYFPAIHTLALVCSDEVLEQRLLERPTWRGSHDPTFIQDQIRFNQWFKDYNQAQQQPTIDLLDTTNTSLDETARQMMDWISGKMGST